jgi:hypothetical protein
LARIVVTDAPKTPANTAQKDDGPARLVTAG